MTSRFRGELVCLLISFSTTLTVGGWSVAGLIRGRKADAALESLESFVVRRGDFDTTLLVGGDLQPVKQTTVTCQVEDITDSDGTMVLSSSKTARRSKKGRNLPAGFVGDR